MTTTIVGTGVDLVDVRRFRGFVKRKGEAGLARLFTEEEQTVAEGVHGMERLAGTFAAKEATLKSLGTGLREMSWRDIEVRHDDLGKPLIRLNGRAAQRAAEAGVTAFHLSISHLRTFAIAQVVAEGAGPTQP